jgi:hypothetical protein
MVISVHCGKESECSGLMHVQHDGLDAQHDGLVAQHPRHRLPISPAAAMRMRRTGYQHQHQRSLTRGNGFTCSMFKPSGQGNNKSMLHRNNGKLHGVLMSKLGCSRGNEMHTSEH